MRTRRSFLAGGAAGLALAATGVRAQGTPVPNYDLPPHLMPQEVRVGGNFAPGVVHVVPDEYALYWTLPGGRAIRYVVGIGRPGLYEPGEFFVGAKKRWPSWTPTPDMIDREPEKYAQYEDGMPGGLSNPLGAAALYLFTEERGDTFLRIHGTDDPSTIGIAVSNGCARLVNDQMVDLYNRVPEGSKVILYEKMRA
ncbi:L,D-transpeptidase [Tranquillimonas alkanivorans]|uniref:L,D-transpeptidase catalytic domain n=1 Tax=Tranquillimonas alkanivorans TaxID=441119 RepID=A0A1I5QQQ0_9RHOB|nr:L,D-transpeptidase [Tranquillimonas alkanivorans]SFP48361.1 L,D-transpeptidase catalytic domain [Tranquillimonas alkanivorans]